MKRKEIDIKLPGGAGRVLECPHSGSMVSLLENIDGVMAGVGWLLMKDGSSTTVGVIKGELFSIPFDILVKRVNYKGALHWLVKKIVGSRVRRLYNVTISLFEKGLDVPRPIGFIEKRRASFYLSSFIENSENLWAAYKGCESPKELAKEFASALAGWHMKGAVHGDLKWSNILVRKNEYAREFFFVDLDQTRLYGAPNIKGINKDLMRFYTYAIRLGAEEWIKKEFLPAYLSFLPDDMKRNIIDIANG